MLGVVSVKGDAQSEAPSSLAVPARVLEVCDRFGGLVFAAFLALHLALEAARAAADGALPHSGAEAEPVVVGAVSLVLVPPFAVFAGRRLARPLLAASKAERSLAVLERLALGVALGFLLAHFVHCAYPLLNGSFDPSDARPELIASLSGTVLGLPLVAVGYAFGVGAACFVATRAALSSLARAGSVAATSARRAVVALGVLAYLLGSYAVIRCATGAFWP